MLGVFNFTDLQSLGKEQKSRVRSNKVFRLLFFVLAGNLLLCLLPLFAWASLRYFACCSAFARSYPRIIPVSSVTCTLDTLRLAMVFRF